MHHNIKGEPVSEEGLKQSYRDEQLKKGTPYTELPDWAAPWSAIEDMLRLTGKFVDFNPFEIIYYSAADFPDTVFGDNYYLQQQMDFFSRCGFKNLSFDPVTGWYSVIRP